MVMSACDSIARRIQLWKRAEAKRIAMLVLAFSSTLAASITSAQETIEYASVGEWTIGVDRTLDNGCFLMAEFIGNTAFRLGVNKSEDGLYVMVADAAWRSIEFGQSYDVDLEFGSRGAWTGEAMGIAMDGIPMLLIPVTGSADTLKAFLEEFMAEQNVKVYYRGQMVTNLSLAGSRRATDSMLECQEVYGWETTDPFANDVYDDPFAGSANDPFAKE